MSDVTAIERIELRFRESSGASHTLVLHRDELLTEEVGISLSARARPIEGGETVLASISNRRGIAIRLDSVRFDLATGFSAEAPARFFKHGYQSWSASRAVAVGSAAHPPTIRHLITRIGHQSEADRPEEAPEDATSELFTIVESAGATDRFFAGFTGAAGQLTTLTVRTPDRVSARALFDGVILPAGEVREV